MNDAVPALRARVAGPVLTPGEEGYDAERAGFNSAVDDRPAVVVGATGPDDVRAAVAYARDAGLPVAVRSTGHGAGVAADGAVLITTRRMTGVRVDPERGAARVEAGVRWAEVAEAAAPYGLAPLSGSAPGVGVVGYTLGGGMPLLGRTYGWAADRVRAIDVVTPDGRARHVTPGSEPDLFWALRGARDNFGVVTALDIELLRLSTLWGGGLYLDASAPGRAAALTDAYRRWTGDVPEEMNSSLALVPLPDVPGLPEPLRGRYVAHIRIAFVGEPAAGERLVAPLRALGPLLIDSLAELPYTAAGSIHNDPPTPMPWNGDIALLDGLEEADVAAVTRLAGPEAPLPVITELRHLGGALARPGAAPSAVGHRTAAWSLGVLSRVSPATEEVAGQAHRAVLDAVAPRTLGRFLTFMGSGRLAAPDAVRTAYEAGTYDRLGALKAAWDPGNTFRLGHPVTPGS
ncbi:FAD-binding oxidoreductase [Streptomyces avicenniae]|uniref:FAD-binding oxidoreductase n=1 Tax=Streptomyces avicenniae TaxID=500153 RepID=UPI00069BAE72|nr:FAD-binding oxidoreductase [Streptomyces avicenniae]